MGTGWSSARRSELASSCALFCTTALITPGLPPAEPAGSESHLLREWFDPRLAGMAARESHLRATGAPSGRMRRTLIMAMRESGKILRLKQGERGNRSYVSKKDRKYL